MNLQNLLSATAAAEFLGLKHRTQFFPVKEQFKLEPAAKVGNVSLYSVNDLKKIRKHLNA